MDANYNINTISANSKEAEQVWEPIIVSDSGSNSSDETAFDDTEETIWLMSMYSWVPRSIDLIDDQYYEFPRPGWWQEKFDRTRLKSIKWWKTFWNWSSRGRLYTNARGPNMI